MRTLIFIPTYNEAGNVAALYQEIKRLGLGNDFLLLDDNSPDGTGEIIDRLADADPTVHTIHRSGKLGIGSAHAEGIRWAYKHGYQVLVTMDCDFTHTPASIPDLLKHVHGHHLVIGSRFLEKDSLPGWNLFRRSLTYGGHFMTGLLLGMHLDATGAFRVYRLDAIPQGVFELISSTGYSFFFESLYILWLSGALVKEVPVTLPARIQGNSKMRMQDAWKSFSLLLKLGQRRLLRPQTLRYAQGLPTPLQIPADIL